MGDISEIRGLVTIGTFITVTVLLIAWVPSEFFVTSETQRTIIPPAYFEAIDLSSFAETWNGSIDDGTLTYIGPISWWVQKDIDGDGDGEFGGYDIDLYSDKSKSGNGRIMVRWVWYWWFFATGSKALTWYDNNGIECSELYGDSLTNWITLTGNTLNSHYATNTSLHYTVKSSSFSFKVYFNFNTTLYNNPVEAWQSNELYVLFGIEFDQVQTAYNAWDIIAMILFFKLPNTHWMINAIIAVPIWIGVAYLSFILILRAIGAIFGGGA